MVVVTEYLKNTKHKRYVGFLIKNWHNMLNSFDIVSVQDDNVTDFFPRSWRSEAIPVPLLPLQRLSKREPEDPRAVCSPHALWQQPVPGPTLQTLSHWLWCLRELGGWESSLLRPGEHRRRYFWWCSSFSWVTLRKTWSFLRISKALQRFEVIMTQHHASIPTASF